MPNTIAENLQRLIDAKTAIGSAITAKGGTVGASDGLEEFAADIATIPSGGGGGGSTSNAVNFYDYDGTIVQSYSKDEFANLSALPANPSHEGLTSQGWNWSLADAKEHVSTYGELNIGQMYVTDDGNTRLHIRLGEGRLKPYLGLTGDSSSTAVSIDWGDGSVSESVALDTSTVYTPHEYSTSGDYTITITVTSGSITFNGDSNYNSNILRKSSTPIATDDKIYQFSLVGIEIGNNVSIGGYAFCQCYSLQSITIPDGVTSIGEKAFGAYNSLTSITIPAGVTTIGNYAFQNCQSLTSITIPDGVTSISVGGCQSLSSITIPDSVTSISGNAFAGCYSLTSFTIPDGVTSIGNQAFYSCNSLQSIRIPDTVTSIEMSAFSACSVLKSITIPDKIRSINGSVFQNCNSLSSITIPDSVTTIGSQAFNYCNSLSSITIPDSVTSIGSRVFNNCYGLGYIKFERTTPPTVYFDTFNIPTDCIILTPALVIDSYMNKTNYPSASSYTYIGYATYASGEALPATTTAGMAITWYATQTDAIAKTNPITQGTSSEVYARA